LELAARLIVMLACDRATRKIAIELGQLIAQDGKIRGFMTHAHDPVAAQKRHDDPRQRREHHETGDDDECDHGFSSPAWPARRRAARACSSADSTGTSACPRRARTKRTSTADPMISNSAGPAHSNTVVALIGGW